MTDSAHKLHRTSLTPRTHNEKPQSATSLASEPASTPTKRKLTRFWKHFKKRDKKEDTAKVAASPLLHTEPEHSAVFGVPLIVSITYANVAISRYTETGESYIYGFIPVVVAKCGVFLKEKGTDVSGIFRLAGSEKRMRELIAQFDAPPHWGNELDWFGYTVHDAANTLRRYLNRLPEPLIPFRDYNAFRAPIEGHQVEAVGAMEDQGPSMGGFDPDATVRIYRLLIRELPAVNRHVFLYMLDLLAVIAAKADVNMMTTFNLAAIFQPDILSHPNHKAYHNLRLSQDVLIFLIDNQDHFLIGMDEIAVDGEIDFDDGLNFNNGTNFDDGPATPIGTPEFEMPTAHVKMEENIQEGEKVAQDLLPVAHGPKLESVGSVSSASSTVEQTGDAQLNMTSFPQQLASSMKEENSDAKQSLDSSKGDLALLSGVGDFLNNSAAVEILKTNFDVVDRTVQIKQKNAKVREMSEPMPSTATWHSKGQLQIIMRFLAALGLVERPLAPGKRRYCGKKLYDDYIELKVGALEDLSQRLEHLAAPREAHSMNGQGYSGTDSARAHGLSAFISGISNVFAFGRKASSSSPHIPLYNRPSIGSSSAANEPKAVPNPLHLLVCMKDSRFGTSVYQEEISELKNDRDLFRFLQDDYMCRRGKLYSLISLAAPESINLVKFNLIAGTSIDVRKHELDCLQHCVCLPPLELVEPEPNAEYRCTPIPPSLHPPLGSELLMHLFTHPECLNNDKQVWILAQFPKKLRGELVGNADGPVAGWGIHFKEGWNWVRIKNILLVYLTASLAFGVVWTVRRDDIQGAFSIAGYLVSTATVFLGYVAMRHV